MRGPRIPRELGSRLYDTIPRDDKVASRAMEFTGERFILGHGSSELFHEHVHRYMVASALVQGRRVVDLGSGSGYGCQFMLRDGASSCVGVDIDPEALAYAEENHGDPRITFVRASADDTGLPAACADIITCFELIEHVAEPQPVAREVARLLAPGGIALISTPETVESHKITHADNPFHLSEMTEDEFRSVVGACFSHVIVFGQRSVVGSWIGPTNESPWQPMVTTEGSASAVAPTVLIAACSNEPLPQDLFGFGSLFIASHEQGQQDRQDLAAQTAGARLQLASYESDIRELAAALATADREIRRLRSVAGEAG